MQPNTKAATFVAAFVLGCILWVAIRCHSSKGTDTKGTDTLSLFESN